LIAIRMALHSLQSCIEFQYNGPWPCLSHHVHPVVVPGRGHNPDYTLIQVHVRRLPGTGPVERQGLLERDAEHSYLAFESADEDQMDQLRGHSITYRSDKKTDSQPRAC
jgi:hypothetical protein